MVEKAKREVMECDCDICLITENLSFKKYGKQKVTKIRREKEERK